jgi:membrane protease subunit HflK
MSQQFYNKDDDNVIDIDVEKLKKRTSVIGPFVLIIVIIAILFTGSIYTLDTKEDGVIVRLGKVTNVVEEAGLHFKVPLIDRVRKVNVETVYNMEYGFRTIQEGTEYSEPVYQEVPAESNVIVDGANNNASIAIMELIIQYKVEDPVNFLFKVDDVEGTLRLALEDVVRSSVQSYTLNQAKTEKEAISQSILPALQKKIRDYDTGIEITKVSAQNVQFLPSVEEAYQQKENANQYKNGKLEDGEKYENTVVPQAQAEAQTIVQEANAYAATVKAAAKADVAQFLALYEEYQNSPEILKERYYLEAMREFLTSNEIVIDLTENQNFLKLFDMQGN